MSVFDVVTKWALEKLDRKYLKKKEFSVEESVGALHDILLDVSDISKYVANILNKIEKDDEYYIRNEFDMDLESVTELRINSVKEGVADIKIAKVKFEQRAKKVISEGNRIRKLNFYLAREGQPDLLQKIAESVDYVPRTFHIVEMLLMPKGKALFESEPENSISLSFLKKYERNLIGHAKNTDHIISMLLDTARKLK
jgi:hypothetical protein